MWRDALIFALGGITTGGLVAIVLMSSTNHPDKQLPPLKEN